MLNIEELINMDSLKKIAENIYEISKIPMAILGLDGTIKLHVGGQDICVKYHRKHPATCARCLISDNYIIGHSKDSEFIAYKCLNNMWDIAMPIIISGTHIATIAFGQFFYDDEIINTEFFRTQALEFGFDEKEYMEALSKVPIFSKDKVEHIIEYYKGLIITLGESGLRQLEYKKSEKALKKNQEYLNTVFNSVNDGIFIFDFDGNILDVNQTAVSMFGYSRNEFIHMKITDICQILSPPSEYKAIALQNMGTNANPMTFERICTNKDAIEFWSEINLRIADIDGNERILAVVRNITERKQAEFALKNEAIQLEKLRTEFFANISHELRTPLNIILGATKINSMNLQKETVDREKLINNINIEKQNCFRLLRLINNLIDSTKLDSGYFGLNMVNCNIINMVEEITLSVSEYMNNNNLTLTFDTEVEEKIIACDLDKIERIMLNILSNAIKFTNPGGKIFVNICDGEKFITISIEDDGIGIPKDKLNIIFDRFRQVDKSFTRNHEGSGIGLSLVKSLVEMQGGTIDVESKYGIGTKFSIKLPVKLIDENKSKENSKLANNNLNNYVEKIKVEFSDIYNICLN